jgi:hypothetical protein
VERLDFLVKESRRNEDGEKVTFSMYFNVCVINEQLYMCVCVLD